MLNYSEETCWSDIKEKILSINPKLYEAIDSIPQAHSLPIRKVRYKYGEIIADKDFFFSIDKKGKLIKETHEFPLFLLVDGCLELYLEYNSKIIPQLIYKKGDFFPFMGQIKNFNPNLNPFPINIFTLHSGLRSLVISNLWNITDEYRKLQKKFFLNSVNPKDEKHHYHIIKKIISTQETSWSCQLYEFAPIWRSKIRDDKNFHPLRDFLNKNALNTWLYSNQSILLNYAITDICNQYNINMSEYSNENIKKILFSLMGDIINFKPSFNNYGYPSESVFSVLKKYTLNNTAPIIFEPNLTESINNIVNYYPLSLFDVSTSSPKTKRLLSHLNFISDTLSILLQEFSNHPLTQNSVYENLYKKASFAFFSERGNKDISAFEDITKFDINIKNFLTKHNMKMPKRSLLSKAIIGIKQLDQE